MRPLARTELCSRSSGAHFVLDVLFLALGAGVLALFGAYAKALRRL
jgi:hypothetical protein